MTAHNPEPDSAAREDDRGFQEMVEAEKPYYSEREKLLMEMAEYMFAKMHFHAREEATEQMRNIANTPDKMRLALMEIRDQTKQTGCVTGCIHDIATNALK